MIANARMYSVSPEVAGLWRLLLCAVSERAGVPITVVEHAEPAPIAELWARSDMGSVFMCGLPFSRAAPRPAIVAAPVPSPSAFNRRAQYWSELVVRADSRFQAIEDTFGHRLALTTPDSQSGCLAALSFLAGAAGGYPLFQEVIAPQVTPLGVMNAVIQNRADVAPVDSYAFYLLQRYRPDLTSQVRVVAKTARTPIPPLVATSAAHGTLQSAFLDAHRNPSIQPILEKLLLERFVPADPASYDVLRHDCDAAMRYWGEHPLAARVHPSFK